MKTLCFVLLALSFVSCQNPVDVDVKHELPHKVIIQSCVRDSQSVNIGRAAFFVEEMPTSSYAYANDNSARKFSVYNTMEINAYFVLETSVNTGDANSELVTITLVSKYSSLNDSVVTVATVGKKDVLPKILQRVNLAQQHHNLLRLY